jgi:hypothetical protein
MKKLAISFYLVSSVAFSQDGEIHPKFAWPASGKVTVKEKALKKGNRAVTTYHLNFKQTADKLHIQYSDFRFLTLNGIPAGDPRLADIKKVEKMVAGGLPEFVVSREGHFIDLGNLDALAAAMLPMAKDKESVKQVLANPQAKKAITAKAGELWFDWVDFWSAVSLQNGKPVVNVPTGFILFDSYNPASSKVEYLGKCPRSPSCIELSLTMNISGSDGAQLMKKGMSDIGAKVATPQSAAIKKFTKVKIDYATLKPFEVLTRTSATIVQDQKTVDAVEEHEYFFDWPVESGKPAHSMKF